MYKQIQICHLVKYAMRLCPFMWTNENKWILRLCVVQSVYRLSELWVAKRFPSVLLTTLKSSSHYGVTLLTFIQYGFWPFPTPGVLYAASEKRRKWLFVLLTLRRQLIEPAVSHLLLSNKYQKRSFNQTSNCCNYYKPLLFITTDSLSFLGSQLWLVTENKTEKGWWRLCNQLKAIMLYHFDKHGWINSMLLR